MKLFYALIVSILLTVNCFSQNPAKLIEAEDESSVFKNYNAVQGGAWIIDSSYYEYEKFEKRYYSNRNNYGRYLNAEFIQFNEESNSWEQHRRINMKYHFDTIAKEIICEEYYPNLSEWKLKYIMQYNEDGNLTYVEYFFRDSLDELYYGILQDLEYDQNGNMTYQLDKTWDLLDENWINAEEHHYEFDENNNETLMYSTIWDTLNEDWVFNVKWIRTYQQDQLKEFKAQIWDKGLGAWVNTDKEIRYYNNNMEIDSIVESSWGNNSWINSRLHLYLYSQNGNLDYKINKIWGIDSEIWENESRWIYLFNEMDQQIALTKEFWQNDSHWANNERYLFEYNINGNRTNYLHQTYTDSTWTNDYQFKYSYDEHFNNIEFYRFEWDQSNQVWDTIEFNRVFYSFFEYTGLAEKKITGLKLFPNPASDKIFIHLGRNRAGNEYNIIDIHGKLVKAGKFKSKINVFSVSDLKPGIYFLNSEGSAASFIVQ